MGLNALTVLHIVSLAALSTRSTHAHGTVPGVVGRTSALRIYNAALSVPDSLGADWVGLLDALVVDHNALIWTGRANGDHTVITLKNRSVETSTY